MIAMDLSVIILSYNVRYLLESCLDSVIQATQHLTSEILVVDNASSDGSAIMVKSKYPKIKLIVNESNLGFSKANNIGVAHASGDYILILNPDTIVPETTVSYCHQYLTLHPQVGAIGVRMVDGQGKFLEESKRGFPDSMTSFFKLSGINKLFPQHKKINQYYMGHLSSQGIHEVEVLTGAFLMIPKKTFEQLGGFDEQFFMYGEDIDLSYRIRLLGKKLVYIGNQEITHLKGRSARSHRYHHVRDFYQAMGVFVKKYQRNKIQQGLTQFLIRIATFASWLKRQVFNNYLFVSDLLIMVMTILVIQYSWALYWFEDAGHFKNSIFIWSCIFYIMIWLLSLFFFKTYDPYHEQQRTSTTKAIGLGTGMILVIYSLLPDTIRTSRAVIVFTGILLAFLLPRLRKFLSPKGNGLRGLFIGSGEEEQVLNHLFKKLSHFDYFSYLSHLNTKGRSVADPVMIQEISSFIQNQKISHFILNASNTSRKEILDLANQFGTKISLFLADPAKEVLVKQYAIPGMVTAELKVKSIQNRISRWLINTAATILILPWGWIMKEIRSNFLALLLGKKNWIGYASPAESNLPNLKAGLWPPIAFSIDENFSTEEINFLYARDYSPAMDVQILWYHLFNKN